MWKEREPTAWKEPIIDERRASDKVWTPNKPATEAAETANMRYCKTTTAAHSTKAAKTRLRRSCYQHGADHSRCRESGEFLIDHGGPPLFENSPRRQFNEMSNEQKLTIFRRDHLLWQVGDNPSKFSTIVIADEAF